MLKINDYVRINPDSKYSFQINEAGNSGKIRCVYGNDAFSVKFKNYQNSYSEIDLIKISKMDWLKGMI